ncbi:MAG: ABC transporter ATP-binding protein [Planctomycetes bacterium]|nr:ABC transporter ATP-binding protein [Planctomycetota bacterium]
MPPLIDIREAWKIYHVGEVDIEAVRGVSLEVPHGQFIAITGASGSGKSTFMHLLGCLDQLTRGDYEFEGRTIQHLSRVQLAALRNQRIGFVFQSFNLLARTSVIDNVALPLTYQGVRRRERRKRAEEMLARVGLADRMRHHTNQLSGGQQQRVAIARALVTRPAIILADEPTGNLDSETSREIMEFFKKLNRNDGVSIMLVTHERDIAAYAQRHVVFRDGLIVRDDSTEAVNAA